MTHPTPSALQAFASAGLPRLLFVTHAWGGGVEQHVKSLVGLIANRARVMVLRPAGEGVLELELPGNERIRVSSNEWQVLINALTGLQFERVHLHHIHGLPPSILAIDVALGVPLDCTLHDYMSVCPQYQLSDPADRYCGEPDTSGCNQCITGRPHAWHLSIEQWRGTFAPVLSRAARVFAPSFSVGNGVKRYFPNINVTLLPHPEQPTTVPRVAKVALLGALSKAKGLSVALAVAEHARSTSSTLLLRLIGHAAEPLPTTLRATGSYEANDLPGLIADERPDVIWLPSQVPETYSFILTAALASGIPIVASNIGALAERLQGIENATLLSHDANAVQWHDALVAASAQSPRALPFTPPQSSRLTGPGSAESYAQRYADVLPVEVAASALANRDALMASAVASSTVRQGGHKALLDMFRIGVYGGHQPSTKVVERALEMMSPGETHLVGRAQYDALNAELNALHETAVTAQETVAALQDEYADASSKWHAAFDDAEARALSARDYIAHLEASVRQQQEHNAQIDAARNEMISSTSWRITRPLRGVVRVTRRARHVASSTLKLIPRAPVLMRGGVARFRRGGWSSVRDRLATEFRVPEAPVAMQLPESMPPVIAPLVLPTVVDLPLVSILIPVYGQHATTFACLASIAKAPLHRSFEIIVMDDSSPEPASVALAPVTGVRIVRNAANLGFIGNVNAAATHARGEWLIILNNDTVVRPGSLDALIDTFAAHKNVGLVGAKLLNADGSVQEAGGIVWRDGSAWNWGRGEHCDDPRFNFVRNADFCSGAALAITRELFANMGGFDPHYAPAYYEDADLAFRIRARGLRVLYQPAAEIFHLEGVSHGRDVSSGVKAYQVTNAKKFFERWQHTLVNHRENAVEPEQEAHRASRSNILIVEACMITPDQDAGSVRLLNLLAILKAEGHHVTYIADNLDGNPKYARLLTGMGVELLHGRCAGSVRAVLRERGPTLDTIMFCRYYIAAQYVGTVRTLAPNARIIFDTVDLHFVREEREAVLLQNPAMHRAAAATRAKELRVIAKSDVTLVVSEFEKSLLAQIEPQARVEIISMIHSPVAMPAPLEEREGILFIGGFRHPPNIDAVQWYAAEVLPRLRELVPDVTTTIVGSNMPDDIKALSQTGLDVRGFVEHTEPLLQRARVSIAPLRFGAGIKGKINEAMIYGIPVVATSCAVEGMHLRNELDVLVADDPLAFAQAIARAYLDATLWNTLSQAGIGNVHTHFSADAALPTVRALFTRNRAD